VRLTPNEIDLGEAGFSQTLDPATGTISITQGDFRANLWFAGETLMLETASATAKALEVAFGTWREKTKDVIRNDMMGATPPSSAIRSGRLRPDSSLSTAMPIIPPILRARPAARGSRRSRCPM